MSRDCPVDFYFYSSLPECLPVFFHFLCDNEQAHLPMALHRPAGGGIYPFFAWRSEELNCADQDPFLFSVLPEKRNGS